MQIHQKSLGRRKAFTLVEMIGVLAVIAILAAMLIPKVFEAMHSSRINNAISGIETIKNATVEHIGKWGKFADDDGDALAPSGTATNPENNFDTLVLLKEGRVDKGFWPKIGSQLTADRPKVQLKALTDSGNSLKYKLDGVNDLSNVTYVLEVVIYKVTFADARELSLRIDGAAMSNEGFTGGLANADTLGRVTYAVQADAADSVTDVYIYITSR